MTEYNLSWNGPHSFKSLLLDQVDSTQFRVPGVYLWIDQIRQPPVVSYVGKASGHPDLWIRQWQHYIGIIGGHYQIPEWHRRERWEMDPGVLEVRRVVFSLESYGELVQDGFRYANSLQIYLCPLRQDPTEIKLIERQLLWDLKPLETPWGTKSPPAKPVTLVHENDRWKV